VIDDVLIHKQSAVAVCRISFQPDGHRRSIVAKENTVVAHHTHCRCAGHRSGNQNLGSRQTNGPACRTAGEREAATRLQDLASAERLYQAAGLLHSLSRTVQPECRSGFDGDSSFVAEVSGDVAVPALTGLRFDPSAARVDQCTAGRCQVSTSIGSVRRCRLHPDDAVI